MWEATLTVQNVTTDTTGCDNGQTLTARKCSTATTLTDDDFSYGGNDYEVYGLRFGEDEFVFYLSSRDPDELDGLTLQMGVRTFAFSDAVVDMSARSATWTGAFTRAENAKMTVRIWQRYIEPVRTYEILGDDRVVCEDYIASIMVRVSPRVPYDTGATSRDFLQAVTTDGSAVTQTDYVGGTFPLGSAAFARDEDDTITLPILALRDNFFEGNEDYTVRVEPIGDQANLVAGGRTTVHIVICDLTLDVTASSSASETGTFSSVTLDPVFQTGTTAFTGTAPRGHTHVKLTPTWTVTGATARVGKFKLGGTSTRDPGTASDGSGTNLEEAVSGTASNAIALEEGQTALTVRVTYPITYTDEHGQTQSGTDTRDYHVTITADPGNTEARLGNLNIWGDTSARSTLRNRLTLSPTFDRDHHALYGHGGQLRDSRPAVCRSDAAAQGDAEGGARRDGFGGRELRLPHRGHRTE